jgi:L-amino acid N-acyltransferase YncA
VLLLLVRRRRQRRLQETTRFQSLLSINLSPTVVHRMLGAQLLQDTVAQAEQLRLRSWITHDPRHVCVIYQKYSRHAG